MLEKLWLCYITPLYEPISLFISKFKLTLYISTGRSYYYTEQAATAQFVVDWNMCTGG